MTREQDRKTSRTRAEDPRSVCGAGRPKAAP